MGMEIPFHLHGSIYYNFNFSSTNNFCDYYSYFAAENLLLEQLGNYARIKIMPKGVNGYDFCHLKMIQMQLSKTFLNKNIKANHRTSTFYYVCHINCSHFYVYIMFSLQSYWSQRVQQEILI